MVRIFVIVFGLLIFQQVSSRTLPEEESVVSVYTTQSTTIHHRLDVYHQIANNIAERITSPIYRFLGIGNNKSEESTTKSPWHKIEILDEPDGMKPPFKHIDNDISKDRDVEELTTMSLKVDKKPEKITLFSSYLPVNEKQIINHSNDTDDDIDDGIDVETFGLDDVDDGVKEYDSSLTYFLEIVGSILQLIYGAIAAFFTSNV